MKKPARKGRATAVAEGRRKRDGGSKRAAAVEGRRGARNATAVEEGRRKRDGGGNRAAAAEGSKRKCCS